jgi:hypothetical protein
MRSREEIGLPIEHEHAGMAEGKHSGRLSRRLTIAFEPRRFDHEQTVGYSREAEESSKKHHVVVSSCGLLILAEMLKNVLNLGFMFGFMFGRTRTIFSHDDANCRMLANWWTVTIPMPAGIVLRWTVSMVEQTYV